MRCLRVELGDEILGAWLLASCTSVDGLASLLDRGEPGDRLGLSAPLVPDR